MKIDENYTLQTLKNLDPDQFHQPDPVSWMAKGKLKSVLMLPIH